MPAVLWPDETAQRSARRGAVVIAIVAALAVAYGLALRLSERSEIVRVREKLPLAPSFAGRGIYRLRTDAGVVPVSRAFYTQACTGRYYEVRTRGIFGRGITRMLRELPEARAPQAHDQHGRADRPPIPPEHRRQVPHSVLPRRICQLGFAACVPDTTRTLCRRMSF